MKTRNTDKKGITMVNRYIITFLPDGPKVKKVTIPWYEDGKDGLERIGIKKVDRITIADTPHGLLVEREKVCLQIN